MNEAHFRSELQQMRDEAASLAMAKLQAYMLKSVLVLGESLDSTDEALRVRAARVTLNAAFKAADSRDLRQRIDVMDDALSLLKRQL
jgi:hypothetical protein